MSSYHLNITNRFSAEQIHIDQTLRDIDQIIQEHQMSGDAINVQSNADQHIVVDRIEDTATRPSMVVFNKFIDPNRKASDIPLPAAPTPSAGPLLKPVARKKKGKKAADGKGPPKKRGRKPKKDKIAVSVSSAPAVGSVAADSSKVPVAKDASLRDETSVVVERPTKKVPGKKRGRKKKTVKNL